ASGMLRCGCSILISTMTVFTVADSLAPRMSSNMQSPIKITAGRLKIPPPLGSRSLTRCVPDMPLVHIVMPDQSCIPGAAGTVITYELMPTKEDGEDGLPAMGVPAR